MHIFPRAAGCAAIGFFVVTCTDGTSSSTTSAGNATGSTSSGGDTPSAVIDMYCNTVARQFCEADAACNLVPSLQAFKLGIDGCMQVVFSGYPQICAHDRMRAELEASLQAGTTVFDQVQFDTCLALLKTMTSGGAACVTAPVKILATTCLTAFRGQGAPGDTCSFPLYDMEGVGESATLPCKDGRCENGSCVPFLKTGDACDIRINQLRSRSATMLCNFPNGQVCWTPPGAGGAGGGGGAGGSEPMGTCRLHGEFGEACDRQNTCACSSENCDATGKCALPDPRGSGCNLP
jgi:hypothetical protein